MSGKHDRRINRFRTTGGHKPHQSFELTVLDLLQAIKPKQMVFGEGSGTGYELLVLGIEINALWGCRDLDHARVSQQACLRSVSLLELLL